MGITERQNILEYYNSLQFEYFVAEIRRKVYTTPSDKRHYTKVMKLKEDKIKDIAVKNSFKSIFNSEETRNEFISRVYPTKGMPSFGKYLKKDDAINYYSKNSTAKMYNSSDDAIENFKVVTIVEYDVDTDIVQVQGDDENILTLKSQLVTRFL